MRAEKEPAHEAPRLLKEVEAEQEVDFGRYGRAVLQHWWLVLASIAVGAVVGYLVSLGGGNVFRATATVYLGQPLSPSGTSQVQNPATNPATVGQIVRSPSVTRAVADQVGVAARQLRDGVSTKTVSGAIARSGQTPLVEVSVRGPWRDQSAEAANLLAGTVVDRVSTYVDAKIDVLSQQLDSQDRELALLESRIEANQAQVEAGDLTSAEQLLILNLTGLLEQRRSQLLEDRVQTRQLLTLAQDVERGRTISEAAPVEVSARGTRNSVLVGAVLGLIVGVAIALLWQPLVVRRARARS